RQQGCMIVVSTHSEQVISRLFTSFAEIIRLDKNEKNEVQIRTIDMAPIISEIKKFYDSDDDLKHNFSRSTHYDQGLLRLLEEKNIEGYLITVFRDFIVTIFSAEIVILGEGASENVLFDYIENVVRPLWQSERRVEFMTCLGKSTMPLYFIFLNGIGIKTFVIYDLDNLDNCVHLAFREAFNRYYRSHRRQFRSYWLQPDLEGFLDIDEPNRIQSMIKPLHIYNKTFLENENNPKLARLLTIMEENIVKL
ncbi:MAG: hypothetical protein IJI05_05085, partial [Erysipelotrichaceae bacterium]|nr:hypothetical protein [Erysipelotrichaceae bacterium]